MGIVKKQAYKNTIVSYAGMVIAYINTVLLFPRIVGDEGYGFYNLIISVSVLYSLVASMGVPGIISKYFTFYRTEDKRHTGFLHWVAWVGLLGFAGATILYVIFKPAISAAYIKNSPLFVRYYYYMIPMALFVIAFNFLEMMGRVIYKNIFSNILQNVVLRLLTTLLLIMIALKWINFNDFVFLYIGANGLISLLLLISLAVSGQFSHRVSEQKVDRVQKKEILNFGLYTLTASVIYVLLQKIDTLMLSSMAGDAVQGVYSWYFNIAIVISVPAQALSRTTYTIVADSWRAKNMANISEVYSKTSLVQMLVGCLLFVGIFINKENLFAIAHNKQFTDPQYFTLFIVIGVGFLVDITGGLNSYIISTSHKYRLNTMFAVMATVLCVGLDYWLIPIYKGLGAAIAYLASITMFNFCTWLYIKYRFKMQPFTYKHLIVVVIAAISFVAGKYLWRMPNLFLDIAVRSLFTTAVYGLLTYYFNISKDVNDKVDSYLNKVLKLIK